MVRRLHPDESELWARVAASVRPLPGRVRPVVAPSPRAIAEAPPTRPEPPRRSPAANRTAVDAATLDGGWDRKMRTGRLVPDLTVDLHGYTRDRAHALLERCIADAALSGARVLLVITGKGQRGDAGDGGGGGGGGYGGGERPRGVIRASLRDWLQGPQLRPFIAALRPAHPRHGGGGAWYVILRRRGQGGNG
ncbi:MAG: Smr/MutS family protein [Janthinobacterium lividum]